MSSLLKIALVMSLVDRVTGPLQRVDDALRRNGQGAQGLAERFGGLARQMEAVSHAGRGLAVAGLAAGGLLGLGSVPADAARAEHALRALGNVGQLTNQQLAEMGRELLGTSKATNQTLAELIQGTNTLVAAGLDPRIATRFMPVIGKAATATQATVDDLSRTLFSVYDNLKVPESALMQAIDTLTASGKEGRFELNNMARYFPMLTAGAQSLQMKGVPAVASLGAALQIAMKGAGTPEEAATNLQNFIQKITSKETVKNFAKFGVDVERELKRATEKGLDPIEHMLNVIMQVTGGNKFKLAEIFGDMQVTNFLVPMMKNLAEYRAIRDRTMTASGVVDKDFQAMMGTTIEQWKALKITMAQIMMPNLAGPLSGINGILKTLTGNAVLAKATFYGIATAVGAGGLLMTLGAMGSVLPKVAAGWAMLGRAKAFFMATERVGMFNEIIRTASPASQMLARMTAALRGTAIAQWALNSAFLANPVTWVVAAIVAGAVLIYRYWGPISGFFRRLWTALTTINWKEAGLNIVRSIWQGITSLASKPVEALKSIAQKMRNLLPFSPAKDGPLRDLHRIRLVETITQAIRPAPMVQAMRGAVGAAMVAAAPAMAQPAFSLLPASQTPAARVTPPGAAQLPATRPGAGAGGAVSITFSPVINVQGGGHPEQIKSAVSDGIRLTFPEFERLMKRYEDQKQRRSF